MRKSIWLGIILMCCITVPIYAMEDKELMSDDMERYSTVSENEISVEKDVSQGDIVKEKKTNDIADVSYELWQYQLQVSVIKQRIAYLSILTDAKQEAYDAVEAKYDLGYAIFSEVKEAEMQKIAVSLQKETAEEQLDFYLACIELRGGEYQEELLAEELAPLDKDYFQIFSEQGIQAYSDGAADVDYEIQWKEYVMNLELQYNTLRREVLQYDNELEVMQMKIDNNKALMEAGKAVQSSFTELKADQQRLQYERSSKVCEGQLILYILEHGIKNQTVSYSL